MRIYWGFGSGSDVQGTADAWAAGEKWETTNQAAWIGSASATFFITGIKLEIGETATPFEHEDYGTTLAKCQRYFAVLQNTTAAYSGAFGYANSTTKTKVCFPLGVSLRANPTVNVTAATIDVRGNGSNIAAASVSAAIAQGTNLYLDVNVASGLSSNRTYGIDPKQNMTFDAEL